MTPATNFADVLEDAEQLTADEQETLMDILRHRLAELRRKQIEAARSEFQQGRCRPVMPDDLIAEISS